MKQNTRKIQAFMLIAVMIVTTMMANPYIIKAASAKKITMQIGTKKTLKVSTKKKTTWKTSNKKIATVSKKGMVKAIKKGTVQIKATYGKKTTKFTVTVVSKKTSKVSPTPVATTTPMDLPSTSPDVIPTGTPIVSPSATPTNTPAPTSTPVPAILSCTFNDGTTQGFTGRGSETVKVSSINGTTALSVSNRTKSWHGAQINLSDKLVSGKTYTITANILHKSAASTKVDMSLQYVDADGNSSYPSLQQATVAPNTWQTLKSKITITDFSTLYLYFQLPSDTTSDFYIKDLTITGTVTDPTETLKYDSLYTLADQYGFSLGTVVNNTSSLDSNFTSVVKKHFNSLSFANEMKAYALLNQTSCQQSTDGMPRMNFTTADKMVQFAKDNNIKIRGHVLVWDAYMCDWFFREGYTNDGALVSADVLKQRMESYIQQVIQHFDALYPGGIYCWDVVNEAVADSTSECSAGDTSRVRTTRGGVENKFYTILGKDYVKYSFEYARKYAPSTTKLFYNDYNCFMPDKRNAICNLINYVNSSEKLIDGIGMQSYLDRVDGYLSSYTNKDQASVPDAVNAFHDLGCDVHLTELTVRNRDITQNDAHAEYYYKLMNVIKNLNSDPNNRKISNVSIWGFVDAPDAQPGSYTYKLSGTYFGLITDTYAPKTSFQRVYDALSGK